MTHYTNLQWGNCNIITVIFEGGFLTKTYNEIGLGVETVLNWNQSLLIRTSGLLEENVLFIFTYQILTARWRYDLLPAVCLHQRMRQSMRVLGFKYVQDPFERREAYWIQQRKRNTRPYLIIMTHVSHNVSKKNCSEQFMRAISLLEFCLFIRVIFTHNNS